MSPRMAMSLAALLAASSLGPLAWAQGRPSATPTAASASAAAPSAASAPAPTPPAAPSARSGAATGNGVRVIEDDRVRIEETRQRGQLARITVQPKSESGSAIKGYEINVGAGGRDPSQDKSGAGQRVWSVLRF